MSDLIEAIDAEDQAKLEWKKAQKLYDDAMTKITPLKTVMEEKRNAFLVARGIANGMLEPSETGTARRKYTRRGTGEKRPKNPDTPCKVCHYTTSPPHDGRNHRDQGTDRKPFTAAELKAKGYVRVN